MKRSVVLVIVVVFAAVGLAVVVAATFNVTAESLPDDRTSPLASKLNAQNAGDPAQQEAQSQGAGKGFAAIDRAAQAKKYLFVFFWKEQDEQTVAMRKVFEAAMQKMSDKAEWVAVNTTDASERGIVDKFGVDRAPMPLVLALAPNGAVTGGFPTKFEEEELLEAFVSPCMEQCMKSLQDNRLVFLCVQNATTESNTAAMQGVRDFKADARFSQATEVVTLDPADAEEAEFLADLKIDPKTPQAVTAFLAPPGVALALFEGPTDRDELVATLEKASTGCGPGGCGPNGCAPRP